MQASYKHGSIGSGQTSPRICEGEGLSPPLGEEEGPPKSMRESGMTLEIAEPDQSCASEIDLPSEFNRRKHAGQAKCRTSSSLPTKTISAAGEAVFRSWPYRMLTCTTLQLPEGKTIDKSTSGTVPHGVPVAQKASIHSPWKTAGG